MYVWRDKIRPWDGMGLDSYCGRRYHLMSSRASSTCPETAASAFISVNLGTTIPYRVGGEFGRCVLDTSQRFGAPISRDDPGTEGTLFGPISNQDRNRRHSAGHKWSPCRFRFPADVLVRHEALERFRDIPLEVSNGAVVYVSYKSVREGIRPTGSCARNEHRHCRGFDSCRQTGSRRSFRFDKPVHFRHFHEY